MKRNNPSEINQKRQKISLSLFVNEKIKLLSTNFSKNIDAVPVNKMVSNIARVAGVFLLIGGIFKAVSHIVDKK